jgi:hypothetical protein
MDCMDEEREDVEILRQCMTKIVDNGQLSRVGSTFSG